MKTNWGNCMNTREIASEYRLSHWARIVSDRSESGMSVREYCKSAGFHENSFYYWQRKLREAAIEHLTEVQPVACQTNGCGSSFTEVRLKEPTAAPALLETTQANQITIALGELRITTDSTYPADRLVLLLRGLLGSC